MTHVEHQGKIVVQCTQQNLKILHSGETISTKKIDSKKIHYYFIKCLPVMSPTRPAIIILMKGANGAQRTAKKNLTAIVYDMNVMKILIKEEAIGVLCIAKKRITDIVQFSFAI